MARSRVRNHGTRASKLQIIGVTPAYVASIRAANPRLRNIDDDELVELHVQGVTPQFVQALAAAGYGNESPDAIGEAAVLGVTAASVRDYARLGPRRSLSDLAELHTLGVTPDFIAATQRPGQPPLTTEQLIELRLTGAHSRARRRRP